jgi:hypothetical protein
LHDRRTTVVHCLRAKRRRSSPFTFFYSLIFQVLISRSLSLSLSLSHSLSYWFLCFLALW